jgi:flagellar assembly protein FliH
MAHPNFSPRTTSAAQISRFDFFALQDFSTPVEEIIPVVTQAQPEAEPTPPAPPSFSEAQLEAAKKKAYAEGVDAGREQAKAEFQREAIESTKQLATIVRELSTQVEKAQQHMDAQWQEQHQGLVMIARHIAQMIAGSAVANKEMQIIEETLQNALPQLMQQPHLTVSVQPSIQERTQTLMQEITSQTGYKGSYSVLADEAAQAGDITITWERGKAERSTKDIMSDIDAMLGITNTPNEILYINTSANK